MRPLVVLAALLLAGCLDNTPDADAEEEVASGEALRHIEYVSVRTYRSGADTCAGLPISPSVGVHQGSIGRRLELAKEDTRLALHFDWPNAGPLGPAALRGVIMDGTFLDGNVVAEQEISPKSPWILQAADLPRHSTLWVEAAWCQGETLAQPVDYDIWVQVRAEFHHQYADVAAAPGIEDAVAREGPTTRVTASRAGAAVCSLGGDESVGPSTSTRAQLETAPGDLLMEGTATWAGDEALRITFYVDGEARSVFTGRSPLPFGQVLDGKGETFEVEVSPPGCNAFAWVEPSIYDVEVTVAPRLFESW